MVLFKNAMEVFQLLDKSNCQECGKKTCLAFAGAVYMCQKRLDECPKIDKAILKQFSVQFEEQSGGQPGKVSNHQNIIDENLDYYLKKLTSDISNIDLKKTAEQIGAQFSGDKLILKVLGKPFSIDTKGKIFTDIHVNPWVLSPVLDYIIDGEGLQAFGKWVSFRELKDGWDLYPLFEKQCEGVLKEVADTYTDLFSDLVHIFGGKKVEKQFKSDISVVLHVLPRVPVMLCYWLPEEGLGSSLNIFFDESADKNLSIDSIFALGAGLAHMFEKLVLKHGFSDIKI